MNLSSHMDKKRLLTSCFGLGWLPFMPGTWGSIPPAIIFYLLAISVPAAINTLIMLVIAIIASVICIKFTPHVAALVGKSDPGEIVIDEVAGQSLVFIAAASIAGDNPGMVAVLGFVFFRIFDILKLWPVKKLETLKDGWGVLVDDLAAAVQATVLLAIVYHLGWLNALASVVTVEAAELGAVSFLGVVQGLTEFLPVSSSGHLVLFEYLFGFDAHSPDMLFLDLMVHMGTLVSIFVVFRGSIHEFIKNLINWDKYGTNPLQIYHKNPAARFLVLGAIATVVTGVIGFSFKGFFVDARASLGIVALMWIVTGTLLLIADGRKKTRIGLRQFGIMAAVIVGLFQAMAIMPGISRSGATICAAIFIGLHRRWAVEFSFLIAIPAILGGTALVIVKDYQQIIASDVNVISIITAVVISFLVGVAALKLLIKLSRKQNLKYFAFYCYALALFVLIYFYLIQ